MKIELTPELAEICGIHIGDGYMRRRGKRYELDISGGLEEKEYYDKRVAPLFEKVFNIKIKTREFPHRNTYGFVIYNSNLIKYLHSRFHFPYGKKSQTVTIPQEVFESKSSEITAAVIRGIFDTDGCLSFRKSTRSRYSKFKRTHNYYPRLILNTTSKKLSMQLCSLLNKKGFKTYTQKTSPKIEKWSQIYRIWLYGKKNLERWIKQIGINNPKHKTKYLVWKKLGYCPSKTTLKDRYNLLLGP